MSHSPHRILIDLEEYNELIALNITYKKFIHKVKSNDLHYQLEIRDNKLVLYIFPPKFTKRLGTIIELDLNSSLEKETLTNRLAEIFDRGLDLEYIKHL